MVKPRKTAGLLTYHENNTKIIINKYKFKDMVKPRKTAGLLAYHENSTKIIINKN